MKLYAKRLLSTRDSVLLYKAPRHNAFMIASFLTGLGIITYAGSNVYLFVMAPTSDNMAIVKYIVAAGGVAAASMGFAITMAPVRLLRSVRLVRTGGEEMALHFEGKRPLPFVPYKQFTEPLGYIWSDRSVPMSLNSWHEVPLKNADLWTEGLLPNPTLQHFKELSFFQKLVHLSANIMPALKKNVSRMFNREGMVYLRVGRQNWKLDLQGCEILDAGKPLMQLVEHDPAVRGTIYDVIRRQLNA